MPFRVDETEIQGSIKLMLNQMHWIDAFPHYADKLPDLLKSINGMTGKQSMPIDSNGNHTGGLGNDTQQRRKKVFWAVLVAMTVVVSTMVLALMKKPTSLYDETRIEKDLVITVNGVSFRMKPVVGGAFQMGNVDGSANKDEKPAHRVEVSSFYIGETEVTQALWKAVLGNNPSAFHGDSLPVESVSWRNCKEFIDRLNELTGYNFRLPTEAEWEYAARGGKIYEDYTYAGNDSIDCVAWFSDLSRSKTHKVKTKAPNKLGLYDMSGNVWEWCSDYYCSYGKGSQTNPRGPLFRRFRVIRGGSWVNRSNFCRVSYRGRSVSNNRQGYIGLRLVLPLLLDDVSVDDRDNESSFVIPDEGGDFHFSVNDVVYVMKFVEGGRFQMGSSDSLAHEDEQPKHDVTVSSFYMGETEVTQSLWKAVMGNNPSHHTGSNLPVEQISWFDCLDFIGKLNNLTGGCFRLPTEAEWEYAARGGKKSNDFVYSGSNNIDEVAWYSGTTNGESTRQVRTKLPNELGLYDMSGNVWEWCSDWYGRYNNESQYNPSGPMNGDARVLRGGSYSNNNLNEVGCRVSRRNASIPDRRGKGRGLRLVLSR